MMRGKGMGGGSSSMSKSKGMGMSSSSSKSKGKGKSKTGMSAKGKGRGYYDPGYYHDPPIFEPRLFDFRVIGTGDQEPTPVITDTFAALDLRVDEGFTYMDYTLDVYNGEAITRAHLHCGKAGINGPLIIEFYENQPNGTDVNGLLTAGSKTGDDLMDSTTECGTNIVSLFQAMKDGLVYLNVHSAEYPGGVVRGQVLTFPTY